MYGHLRSSHAKGGECGRFPRHIAALALVALGLSQLAAAAFEIPWLARLSRASVAAPAPLGFSHFDGVELFALRIRLAAVPQAGEHLQLDLDRTRFERLPGPLNRRYVYIRAIYYGLDGGGPELRALQYGLCADGPLARHLGITKPIDSARLHAITLTAGDTRSWTVDVLCPR
jgi:hypothetical protein